MIDPREQYERNSTVYDHIGEQVEQTTDYFADAPRTEQKMLLNQAVTFALISAQTTVEIHEKGYLNTLEATDFNEIEEGLLEPGVNYYRNKAKYIFHNFPKSGDFGQSQSEQIDEMTEPDYEMVLDLYDEGKLDEMHRAIADEFKGVSTRKAAFAMAKVVTTDKMCLDTNVAQRANIEPDDIYTGVVVEKYEEQCRSVTNQWPDLYDELGAFMFQWVLFDSNKETVTCHEVWFESLPEQVGVSVM